MKVVIGIIVVLGLGWLLLGAGGGDDAATDTPATEEAMEENGAMEEGDHDGDAMMEESGEAMEEGGAETPEDGEAMEEGDSETSESGEAMEEESSQ